MLERVLFQPQFELQLQFQEYPVKYIWVLVKTYYFHPEDNVKPHLLQQHGKNLGAELGCLQSKPFTN